MSKAPDLMRLCVCPHCGKDIFVNKEELQASIKEAVHDAFHTYFEGKTKQ